MIIETIVTTLGAGGRCNPAPMGVVLLSGEEGRILLRPFKTTHTFRNLKETGFAVVNMSWDGALYVYTALGDPDLPLLPADRIPGRVLRDHRGYWEVQVEDVREEGERAAVTCRIVKEVAREGIWGFNRARAALVEGAILATRLHLYAPAFVKAELDRLAEVVARTGGLREREAMDYLQKYAARARKVGEGNAAD
ncbi:MAG TPA: DUF447 family protein [Firmicutes bacterium]|nr:DUF447 family protein [Bacillota bacterium]